MEKKKLPKTYFLFCQILLKKNKYVVILSDLHGQTTPGDTIQKTFFLLVEFISGSLRELRG